MLSPRPLSLFAHFFGNEVLVIQRPAETARTRSPFLEGSVHGHASQLDVMGCLRVTVKFPRDTTGARAGRSAAMSALLRLQDNLRLGNVFTMLGRSYLVSPEPSLEGRRSVLARSVLALGASAC